MSGLDPIAILRAIIFGVSVTITSGCIRVWCKSLSEIAPRDIPFQPPAWVFGVVWPCLYVTTGAGWAMGKADAALGAVTFLCCAWLMLYACWRQKRIAALSLGAICILTIVAAVMSTGAVAGWLLAPLAAWTAFATYLNAYDAFLR
jgi:tryptophan-rich sensory protein